MTEKSLIPREIRRLGHWKNQLERRSARFSNLRFALFFAAFTCLVLGALSHPGGYVGALTLFIVFGALAYHHKRVADMLARVNARLQHDAKLSAIAALDWSSIPELPLVPLPKNLPSYFGDLDLLRGQSLLRLLNQTASTSGYLRLVERLNSNGISDEEILRRRALIAEVHAHRVLRRNFIIAGQLHAGSIEVNRLEAILAEPFLKRGGRLAFQVQFALQLVALASSLLYFIQGGPPYFLLPALLVFGLRPWVHRKILVQESYEKATDLAFSISKLRAVTAPLERLSHTRSPKLRELLVSLSPEHGPRVRLRKLEWIVGALGVRQNWVAQFLCHLPIPWSAFWTLVLEDARKDLAGHLPLWLEALAELEALTSFAEFQCANPGYQEGELTADSACLLQGRELRHPLIEKGKAIANDLDLSPNQKCLLITGSNMSGKSTFLRSVGLTLLLAKAGARVSCARFKFRNLDLGTSLRLTDSLEDGYSSFYVEVRQLRGVLDLVSASRPGLYLIDEIFRGTNSRERLIGSQAYIQQLAATPSCGLVTTHDLELISLEAEVPALVNFHFKDELNDGQMSFSYKMARGPCPTTNALKVMRMGGLFLTPDHSPKSKV